MADEERDRIRKRQREGIDVALQNGTVLVDQRLLSFKLRMLSGSRRYKRSESKARNWSQKYNFL